jgi:hypothetical protein
VTAAASTEANAPLSADEVARVFALPLEERRRLYEKAFADVPPEEVLSAGGLQLVAGDPSEKLRKQTVTAATIAWAAVAGGDPLTDLPIVRPGFDPEPYMRAALRHAAWPR